MDISIENLNDENLPYLKTFYESKFSNIWSFETFLDDFNSSSSQYIVAKLNNEIVGFAGIKIVLDEAEIMNIVTSIFSRNNGVGSKLLNELINISKENNCLNIFLEVEDTNLPAIHIYEKFGFNRLTIRKKYYNNTKDAIIMKKENTYEK